MNTVILTRTPTNDYQINIPKEIFDPFGFKDGTSFELNGNSEKVEFIPTKRIKSLKGIFKGMDTTFEREEEDRI